MSIIARVRVPQTLFSFISPRPALAPFSPLLGRAVPNPQDSILSEMGETRRGEETRFSEREKKKKPRIGPRKIMAEKEVKAP